MKGERLIEMEKYIREQRSVSLDTLCSVFNVSKNTVRRDVAQLIATTDIQKIYGGVSIQFNRIPPSFTERAAVNLPVKQRIGKYAASLVQDGDVIFIDAGTTTCQMINYMGEKKNVTIITHSLDVITRAFAYPNLNEIVISGTLNRKTYSFTNHFKLALQENNISKAFMAATGFTIENGATQAISDEFAIKKCAAIKSDQVILMAESYKIGTVCFLTYAHANRFSTIITDKQPNEKFTKAFNALGGSIIIP